MFPSYSRETLLKFALATLHNRMDVDVTPGTFWYKVAETWAEATTSLSGYQQHIAKQILPSTAETAALERHAKVRGLTRKAARRAEGVVSIVLTAE